MKLIKIKSVPDGEAPFEIRNAWLDVVLPLDEDSTVFGRLEQHNIYTGHSQGFLDCAEFYIVNISVAVELLRRNAPQAAEWWDNLHLSSERWLGFKKSDCQELVGANIAVLEENLVKTFYTYCTRKVDLVVLLQAYHSLEGWLNYHKMADRFNSPDDRIIVEPFWGLCSRYFIELSEEEKIQIMQNYLDD